MEFRRVLFRSEWAGVADAANARAAALPAAAHPTRSDTMLSLIDTSCSCRSSSHSGDRHTSGIARYCSRVWLLHKGVGAAGSRCSAGGRVSAQRGASGGSEPLLVAVELLEVVGGGNEAPLGAGCGSSPS